MAQLLAREVELQRLEGYLRQAMAGQGQVCFVSGEAGSGKTTLLQEFSHQAIETHASLIAVTGTCDAHTGSGDAFLPFREIMEQLTGDLEERIEQVVQAQGRLQADRKVVEEFHCATRRRSEAAAAAARE